VNIHQVTHARAAIVKDARGGGLQLMSHGMLKLCVRYAIIFFLGEPPLILSYCREYWDGEHITHLSAADRKEVINRFPSRQSLIYCSRF
jgi:hypothetical protein